MFFVAVNPNWSFRPLSLRVQCTYCMTHLWWAFSTKNQNWKEKIWTNQICFKNRLQFWPKSILLMPHYIETVTKYGKFQHGHLVNNPTTDHVFTIPLIGSQQLTLFPFLWEVGKFYWRFTLKLLHGHQSLVIPMVYLVRVYHTTYMLTVSCEGDTGH